ncbi:MAG: DUF4038 domain-containing protein [Sedimentisphaerales bacterium]
MESHMRNENSVHLQKKSLFLFPLLVLSAICCGAYQDKKGQNPWDNGKLVVSENGRYLQHDNGKPFFWLGDTCWLLVQKLNRDEIKTYFADRKAKGFNVVQTVIVQMLTDKTVYDDSPIVDGDITKLNVTAGSDFADAAQYDYWDHVDYAIETAAANGIYLAVAPMWSHTVRRTPITKEQAEVYASAVAERLKNKPNIIWLNGGAGKGDVDTDVWQAIGAAIKKNDPNHLMTFHPFGRTQSSTWFNDAAWLNFNMFVSGHRRYDQDDSPKKYGEDNWRYVLEDLSKTPRKPTLDGEPSYEAIPQGLHDVNQPYWTADDVRRYAYWSVFAGACGHTYGQNAVRQVYKKGEIKPSSAPKRFFVESLDDAGACQMQYVKNLILSRPYFDRVNDQSLVADDEGEKYDRVLVTKGKDFLMAYTYTGREFKLKLGRISGKEVVAWWFNPRTGEATKLGNYKNKGSKSFDPPGEKANGNDWVLVLDDASKKFSTPGMLADNSFQKPRVIVSSDIGGSDPDDHQSMVHLLTYADSLGLEGLISTQTSLGNKKAEILKVIGLYEHDYPNLKTYSDKYPTPDALRAITKSGLAKQLGASGIGQPTEGSDWIIQCARRDDPRPLYVLVWGGIHDVAQALHDAPDILPKLRVYFIGGPNKQGSVNAYNYIEQNFPKLWMIEDNATYRGWFVGGNQTGEWGNREFVTRHVAGHGALGDFYVTLHESKLKMGDTPSVGWLLHGVPEDPTQPGWGGKFVRVWDGRKTIFDHLPTNATEQAEVFGVIEIALPVPKGFSATNTATLILDGRGHIAGVNEGKVLRFRFATRDVKVFSYVIKSDFAGLDGKSGTFSAVRPPIERTSKPSTVHPNWWTDDPDPAMFEGVHPGAKSINQWRVDFLSDFAARMERCKAPAGKNQCQPPQVQKL